MQLHAISLKNIRSYTDTKIEFPLGSVLLAGDIGCGKSSVLLAIEFALFGLKQGELSGGSLLSHGAKQGSVTLSFSIDENNIEITRSLKRVKDRIGQASGSITINGVQTDAMPKELRAKIFDLLNYPLSLVSKNQDLIYRYTVYTPQEQMKRILYEDDELRVETLRKVFNIDKYKQIRENALLYLRSLKDKGHHFEGQIEDLVIKKQQFVDLDAKQQTITRQIEEGQEQFEKQKQELQEMKQHQEEQEKKLADLSQKREQSASLDAQLKEILLRRKAIQERVEKLKAELEKTPEPTPKDLAELSRKQQEQSSNLLVIEKKCQDLLTKKTELITLSSKLKEDCNQVKDLDSCPLCKQNVAHSHKEQIVGKTNQELKEIKERHDEIAKVLMQAQEEKDASKKSIEVLQKEVLEVKTLQIQKKAYDEKKESLLVQQKELEETKKQVALINERKGSIEKDLVLYDELYKAQEEIKKRLQQRNDAFRDVEILRATLQKEAELMRSQKEELSSEIEKKEQIAKELAQLKKLISFLSSSFLPLVATIEKHVFSAIYQEFNSLFQRWFSALIEDTTLSARLDDQFRVVIEQNGYESAVEYLSGGEKTSVALAYRLALNRVINDVMSTISTKDLLVLDEPTEGFSDEQLDRVRDVLTQLGVRQVLIVSHEQKIESFVDHIIRIHKKDGISAVF